MLDYLVFLLCFIERSERNYPRIFWGVIFLLAITFSGFDEVQFQTTQTPTRIDKNTASVLVINSGGGKASDPNYFVPPKPEVPPNNPDNSAMAQDPIPKPKYPWGIDPSYSYKPGGGGGGSNPGGSPNYDFDDNLYNSGNSDQVISDPEFWDSIETLGESDEEEYSPPTEAPKTSPPTGKLTKKAIQNSDATTKIISPIEFNDWEGESRSIKSRELKKTVFAKGYDAGVVPAENLVPCPVQNDPAKFQRERCGLITDQSAEKMRDKLIDLTISRKEGRVKLQLDMPFYDTEKATAYMDINTGDCAFYHKDNGKYWTYAKYNDNEVREILANSDWVKYAKPYNSNSEL